jgi:hypothetical protein
MKCKVTPFCGEWNNRLTAANFLSISWLWWKVVSLLLRLRRDCDDWITHDWYQTAGVKYLSSTCWKAPKVFQKHEPNHHLDRFESTKFPFRNLILPGQTRMHCEALLPGTPFVRSRGFFCHEILVIFYGIYYRTSNVHMMRFSWDTNQCNQHFVNSIFLARLVQWFTYDSHFLWLCFDYQMVFGKDLDASDTRFFSLWRLPGFKESENEKKWYRLKHLKQKCRGITTLPRQSKTYYHIFVQK